MFCFSRLTDSFTTTFTSTWWSTSQEFLYSTGVCLSPVTFDAMSGTLRYNCSSQHWSASDLTWCSGALHANSTILQFVTDLILYSELVVSDAGICHTTLMWGYFIFSVVIYHYAVSLFYTFRCWCSYHSWHDGPHWHRYNNNTIDVAYCSHRTFLHGAWGKRYYYFVKFSGHALLLSKQATNLHWL